MGNNVAAGYAVAATPGAMGFQKTLEYTMFQYNIEPWDAKSLLQPMLQRQQELSKNSGLRFINVGDGLAYYGRHCGGWITQLTREKFVQLSMQLFRERGVMCPPDEARLFYDIFDSIDLYKNATLTIGELAGGLTSFFGGSLEQRSHAVFDLLDSNRSGQLTKQALQEFLKPYVYCMVPHDVLRPSFYTHVTNEIAAEITGYDRISREELIRWMRRNYSSEAFITQNVPYSNVIVERAATIIERAVRQAHFENSRTKDLRSYGKESWEQNTGQQQYLRDVGPIRYAANAAPALSRGAPGPAPPAQPGQASLWTQVTNQAGGYLNQAGGYLNTLWTGEDGVVPAASITSLPASDMAQIQAQQATPVPTSRSAASLPTAAPATAAPVYAQATPAAQGQPYQMKLPSAAQPQAHTMMAPQQMFTSSTGKPQATWMPMATTGAAPAVPAAAPAMPTYSTASAAAPAMPMHSTVAAAPATMMTTATAAPAMHTAAMQAPSSVKAPAAAAAPPMYVPQSSMMYRR